LSSGSGAPPAPPEKESCTEKKQYDNYDDRGDDFACRSGVGVGVGGVVVVGGRGVVGSGGRYAAADGRRGRYKCACRSSVLTGGVQNELYGRTRRAKDIQVFQGIQSDSQLVSSRQSVIPFNQKGVRCGWEVGLLEYESAIADVVRECMLGWVNDVCEFKVPVDVEIQKGVAS